MVRSNRGYFTKPLGSGSVPIYFSQYELRKFPKYNDHGKSNEVISNRLIASLKRFFRSLDKSILYDQQR